jgi:hypothetical protein
MPGCSKIYLNYGATTSIVAKKKGATSTTTDRKKLGYIYYHR